MQEIKNVTSIDQLKEYGRGQVIELPPFADEQPFVARIRRPSMLALVKSKKIPNSLLSTANNLFISDIKSKVENEEMMDELLKVMEVIAEASFVEPTFSEIKEAGIELTDDQYMFIFNYSQNGVKALESFRG